MTPTAPASGTFRQSISLAGAETATVLAGRPLGQGMVYLLLDESAWTNEGFDQADNAATLARVLERQLGPEGVLAFDEYRHGYGQVESFTTLFLSLPGAKDFVAMALPGDSSGYGAALAGFPLRMSIGKRNVTRLWNISSRSPR